MKTAKTNKINKIAKTATLAVIAGAVALGLAGPADAAAGTMYGDPVAAAKYWRYQKYDDCVLMSSADVIGQITGSEPSERAIIKLAQATPSVVHPGSIYTTPANTKNPNSGMGTSFADIPTLLALYKIDATITNKEHAAKDGILGGIEGLEEQLGEGHQVIVSVNGELIWGQAVENKDDNGNPRGDHAVVVTGIDTANNVVHLNDSGTKDGRDEQIPMALFMKAWEASKQLMVFTS
ncbi:Papain-like cysteine protease AvrRpt2 [Mycobacterium lentiflavum]|uniref:Papain-like cysteine protease AvrRpt2 n=1 Tax=Mycobacterium lentiflavum TaxID=141349 RepID=A0A0E4GZW1_MYCLN|nr:C39 family peptidase [Mycobacterium lentiflavum]CQD19197.1 Papain-like cysteine protease AvrRpt2 [Mycobacterium lentiflavum]